MPGRRTPGFPDLFDCLTPEEQETLSGFLDRITAGIEPDLGAVEKGGAPDGRKRLR